MVMKKVLLLLIVIGMMATAAFGQIVLGQQTVTFMNCRECENYYEPEVDVLNLVGLVISSDTILEYEDCSGISESFYSEFPKWTVKSVDVFLHPDDVDISYIVIRKDLDNQTRAIYLLTQKGWLQSVDMQDFRFFDRLVLWFTSPLPKSQVPVLRKNDMFR
ncbi:hypothetical protein II582_03220 [bacterium]|nr:hypothetical protein [bacterium]